MNFGEIKALVSFYIHRTDLDPLYPQFFEQVRERISKDARLIVMETAETITLDGDNKWPLDVDWIEFRSVNGSVSGGKRPLQLLSSGDFERYARANFSNQHCYRIEGGTLEASKAGDLDLVYYKRPALLVNDQETNPVLTRYPNLYLFCALMYANNSIQDTETEQLATAHYQHELELANDADETARFSGDAPTVIAR